MGAAHGCVTCQIQHFLVGDVDAQGIQFFDDPEVTCSPFSPEIFEYFIEMGSIYGDPKSQNMHESRLEFYTEFASRDDFHAEAFPCLHGFDESVGGVMIGQSKGFESEVPGMSDKFRGGKGPVGGRGMGVEIDCRHVCAPAGSREVVEMMMRTAEPGWVGIGIKQMPWQTSTRKLFPMKKG